MMPWGPESWFLSFCHILGGVSPWIGSFFYHLFMNLQCGESIYRRLLQVDMLGIWISQSFGRFNTGLTFSKALNNFTFLSRGNSNGYCDGLLLSHIL